MAPFVVVSTEPITVPVPTCQF